ncbi:MAG: hypothetical protein GY920_15765 [Aliivibrio sp.]|nr:hypothetical protein [Aliivibrio sp.]
MNLVASEAEMAANGYFFIIEVIASLIATLVMGVGVPVYLLGPKGLIGFAIMVGGLVLVAVSSTGIVG